MRAARLCALGALFLAVVGGLSARSGARHSGEGGTARSAGIARGKKVCKGYCAICHYSASAKKKIGPGLRGLGKRGKFSDGTKVDDASLRRWIEKGGKDMPGFEGQLSDAQLRDLIAYLRTL